MKINLLRNTSVFICAVTLASFSAARAETINSTPTGPINGNWSDPANWSPPIVPDNTNDRKFNVSIAGPDGQVTLDINAAIQSLAFTDAGDLFSSFLNSADHDLFSGATNVDG